MKYFIQLAWSSTFFQLNLHKHLFTTGTPHRYGCELDFTILIEQGAVTEGAEFAIYKKWEPIPNSFLRYYSFIIYKTQDAMHYEGVVAQRYIDPQCNSWQVFNLTGITKFLTQETLEANELHEINLLMIVFKETDPYGEQPPSLSCDEIQSLFIINSSANLEDFLRTEPLSEEAKDISQPDESLVSSVDDIEGWINEDDEDTQALEDKTKPEEGSGEVITPTEEVMHQVDEFLPTLSVFIRDGPNPLFTKRSATDKFNSGDHNMGMEKDKDVSSGRDYFPITDCKLINKTITLSSVIAGALLPVELDINECASSSENVECRPSKYSNQEILVKNGEIVSIEIYNNLVIEECMAYINNQLTPTS